MTERVVHGREKLLVFCNGPTEQEFLNAVFNLCGLRSKALLARYDGATRKGLVDQFNLPHESERYTPSKSVAENLLDILIVSVNQSTGLNFQHNCCKELLVAPAPSHPTWLQFLGRVVRLGQKRECTIIELYDPFTYNKQIVAQATRRALPTMGAALNSHFLLEVMGLAEGEMDEDGNNIISEEKLRGFVWVEDELRHKSEPDFPEHLRHAIELRKL